MLLKNLDLGSRRSLVNGSRGVITRLITRTEYVAQLQADMEEARRRLHPSGSSPAPRTAGSPLKAHEEAGQALDRAMRQVQTAQTCARLPVCCAAGHARQPHAACVTRLAAGVWCGKDGAGTGPSPEQNSTRAAGGAAPHRCCPWCASCTAGSMRWGRSSSWLRWRAWGAVSAPRCRSSWHGPSPFTSARWGRQGRAPAAQHVTPPPAALGLQANRAPSGGTL